jgi:hypothetical protein
MEIFHRVFIAGTDDPHPQAHEIDEESKAEAPNRYTGEKNIAVLKWVNEVPEWGPCQTVWHAS